MRMPLRSVRPFVVLRSELSTSARRTRRRLVSFPGRVIRALVVRRER